MAKNGRNDPGIPHLCNDWGTVLLALGALAAGLVLILSGKAAVPEAVMYTSPAWAVVSVRRLRRFRIVSDS